MDINIEKMDNLGNGIGKANGKVVFVKKGVPFDKVSVKIISSHKNYDVGIIQQVLEGGENRRASKCKNYDLCGGCEISNLDYDYQLQYKVDYVRKLVEKELRVEEEIEIIPSIREYQYRNKITFHVVNGIIGLVGIDQNIIDVCECLLVSERVNKIYQKIKGIDLSKVRLVSIRECSNGIVVVVDGEMEIDKIKDDTIGIYNIKGKALYKKMDAYMMLGNISLLISPNSFFQVNQEMITKLYDTIVEVGEFNQSDVVMDLYCGVGSISLYISRFVKEVRGIEIMDEAIECAKENAKRNGILNFSFKAMDLGKIKDNILQGNKVIVDPPRSGLDRKLVDALNENCVDSLVYVSCNPATFVRDVKLLEGYQLVKIKLVDMFPQTHHVECVGLLKHKY